jgi:hypothetical protein
VRRPKAQAATIETRVWDAVTLAVFLTAVVYVLTVAGR